MKLINNVNNAIKKLYKHVGFVEDWVLCPISDCTDKYWIIDEDVCKYADSKEQLKSDGDYCCDDIYKSRFYDKWVYKGEQLTMVMCNPHVDGVKWFRIFDNNKYST